MFGAATLRRPVSEPYAGYASTRSSRPVVPPAVERANEAGSSRDYAQRGGSTAATAAMGPSYARLPDPPWMSDNFSAFDNSAADEAETPSPRDRVPIAVELMGPPPPLPTRQTRNAATPPPAASHPSPHPDDFGAPPTDDGVPELRASDDPVQRDPAKKRRRGEARTPAASGTTTKRARPATKKRRTSKESDESSAPLCAACSGPSTSSAQCTCNVKHEREPETNSRASTTNYSNRERIDHLRENPYYKSFGAHHIVCAGCNQSYRTDKRRDWYYQNLGPKHLERIRFQQRRRRRSGRRGGRRRGRLRRST